MLEDYYRDRPGGLTEARLRMARVPEGAELIANPSSGAPGIRIGNVYIMAGVPHIAAAMLEALTGTLEGGRPMRFGDGRRAGAGKRRRRSAARDRGADIPAWRSAAIPSSRTAATAPISSSARTMAIWRGAAATMLSERLREAGFEPVDGGI